MIPYGRKVLLCLFVMFLASSALRSEAFPKVNDNCIAIAYSQKNYQGLSWEICKTGEYDLWWKIDYESENQRMMFNLPNDSISSVRVRPGYEISLYEHAELGGERLVLKSNIASLGPDWNRQASSLTASVNKKDKLYRWLNSIKYSKRKYTSPKNDLSRGEIAGVLRENELSFMELRHAGESNWYGDTSDSQRVDVAAFLIVLFENLGYDMSFWSSNAFAQEINNFYDWNKIYSVWQAACLVLNIDGQYYDDIFDEMKK